MAVSVTGNEVSTHVIVIYLSIMGLTSTTAINVYLMFAGGEEKKVLVTIPTIKVCLTDTYFVACRISRDLL